MCVPSGVSPKIGASYSPLGGVVTIEVVFSSTMSVMSAVLRDLDRILGTVGRSETSLLVQVFGYFAVDQQHSLAEVIDIEQLRCQRVAAVVTLALLRIEMHSHGGNLKGRDRDEQSRKKVFSPVG